MNWPKGLSAPATRALAAAGYTDLADLTRARFVDLAGLHGVGPKALALLEESLKSQGLEFAEPAPRSQAAWARAVGRGQQAGNQQRPAGGNETEAAKARRESAAKRGTPKEPKAPPVELEVDGRTVKVSSPDRIYFPEHGWTKLDVVNYYLSVGDGIVRALRDRPTMLHRFPKGLAGDKVFQKRIPPGAPPWVETVRLHFPRYNQHADELCVTELGAVAWAAQMATVEFHPWNVRRADVDRPDEWRIDLDPMPDCDFDRVRRVALTCQQVLEELGITGYPKTSGGHGLHIYVRITPEWEFADVRRAAWGFAREVQQRLPDDVTTAWWRKDRDPAAVFVDYNQNSRDHTLAAAYSLRGLPSGTVSTPITWDEVDTVEPKELTLGTVPARFAQFGDLHASIDRVHHRLDTLLAWADRFERDDGALPVP